MGENRGSQEVKIKYYVYLLFLAIVSMYFTAMKKIANSERPPFKRSLQPPGPAPSSPWRNKRRHFARHMKIEERSIWRFIAGLPLVTQ
jgi:hypothetical protein